MTRSRSTLGLLFMAALCLCAFGASNASALTMHQCKETHGTGTGKTYKDSKCSEESAEGKFETVPAAAGTSHELTATLTPTTGTEETHAVLHGVIGGIAYKITCKKLSSPNSVGQSNAGPPMTVTGSGKAVSEECTMTEPGHGCSVPATLTTEELKTSTEAMDVKFESTVSKFIAITISGCEGAFKVLNGNKSLEGVELAEVEEGKPTSLMFNATGSTLTFGGQPAIFEAVVHFASKNNGETAALETP